MKLIKSKIIFQYLNTFNQHSFNVDFKMLIELCLDEFMIYNLCQSIEEQ